MLILKETCEYRVDTEEQAKEAMEILRDSAAAKGYTIGSCGYTKKEKKAKGEIIDEAFLIKCVKIYGTIWDNI
nr:MAG TPA: hypothetical protein [Caudoviricetes sp.]